MIKCNECGYEGEPKIIIGDMPDFSYGEMECCPECGSEDVTPVKQ